MQLNTLKSLIILPSLLFVSMLGAQNLVQNSSLETYNNCPSKHGTFAEDVPYWSAPTQGSTDYFNRCSKSMGMRNFIGTQDPQEGDAYAGFYMFAPNDYREYMQTVLLEPLKKGVTYEVSFYVSLSDKSYYGVKQFGVLFSGKQLKSSFRQTLSKGELSSKLGKEYHYIELSNVRYTTEQKKWVKITGEVLAKGYEKYMIIGNYRRNSKTPLVEANKKQGKKAAYYYIDQVAIEALDSYELGITHIFDNLNFETNKFEIKGDAEKELKQLHTYLKKDSKYHISIMGHTDSVGGNNYNKSLSQRRAAAVSSYLMKLGISKDRIQWEGHGGLKPIKKNTTEEGRKTNRRVEFVITEFDDADMEGDEF